MKSPTVHKRTTLLLAAAAAGLVPGCLHAQFGPPPPARPPGPARQAAPIDLTGYWVSVVTEDWRFRMVVPPKGDFSGVPLNAEGRKITDAWDPAKDVAAGTQCKAYGTPAIMRVPGRFHITWQDDNTLKIEADSGTQTRLLHFGAKQAPAEKPSWQGYSIAQWQMALGGGAGRGGEGQPGAQAQRGGSLKVVTTNLRPGYLRKNGVPYSEKTTVTEYYDLVHEPDGNPWLIVKTIVEDPTYLFQPFVTSTNLKKQADGSGWSPSPCLVN
ncbi:MAG TPA: hypothetical protein VJ732_19365 [Bryobacteraceae bacterium]|nr:hypothetical protein [Bryobacteraceae bacterium]